MIRLSDGRLLCVPSELMVRFCFSSGDELTEEFISDLGAKISSTAARSAAAVIASLPVFSPAVREKLLKKGFSEEDTEAAVEWLFSVGGLDDEACSKAYALHRLNSGSGPMKIYAALSQKGLPRDIIEAALASLPPYDDILAALAEKKIMSCEGRDAYAKTCAFLVSKGFYYDDVKRAVRSAVSKQNNNYQETKEF